MNSNTGVDVAESFAAGSLANTFAEIKDQRARRGIRYPLAPLLVLLMLAKLCGEDRPKAIAEWVAWRAQALKKLLHLNWKAMPHASTYRRLMQSGVAVTELERKAGEFLSGLNLSAGELLNLDGKTLRGTIPDGQTQGLHLLSLQEANSNRVLAQVEVGTKENEISAAPGLVAQVEIKGRIISGDAMQAQRQLSAQIVQAGGDYLWTVKNNQPSLRADLETLFTGRQAPYQRADFRTAETLDKGHGRIEGRQLTASSALNDYLEWPFVGQVFEVERETFDCGKQQTRREIVYGITSLTAEKADAGRLLFLVRGHWSIENGLHYRRDVTFGEDACRMKSRAAAQVMAVLNNLAIGLFSYLGRRNAAEARRYFGARIKQALSLILCCLR